MTGDDEPVHHSTVSEPADLRAALEQTAIEYLAVDEQRTVVIYQQAILMVIATTGRATAAQAFDVEFWEESPDDPSRNPEAVVEAFTDELLAATGATQP